MAKKVSAKDLNAATDAFIRVNTAIEPARLKAWDDLGLTVTQLRLLFRPILQSSHVGQALQ